MRGSLYNICIKIILENFIYFRNHTGLMRRSRSLAKSYSLQSDHLEHGMSFPRCRWGQESQAGAFYPSSDFIGKHHESLNCIQPFTPSTSFWGFLPVLLSQPSGLQQDWSPGTSRRGEILSLMGLGPSSVTTRRTLTWRERYLSPASSSSGETANLLYEQRKAPDHTIIG